MPKTEDTTPQAVQSCHDLITWIIPQIDQFPRVRRFTLGERIESGLLEILEQLIEAAYGRAQVKADALRRANLRLDVVRHLWRVGHSLQSLPTRPYAHGARLLEDLGRQIGGWRRDTARRS